MEQADPSETTYLLRAWADGDPTALDRLTPHVYQELRRLAGHYMRDEQPGRTLQTTAVVHEAYLRLVDVQNVDWLHRAHFYAVSAQIMRRILLDAARKRATAKRGGLSVTAAEQEFANPVHLVALERISSELLHRSAVCSAAIPE